MDRLRAEYERIRTNLSSDVTDEDYARLEERIASVRSLARIANRSVALYDVHRRRFVLKIDRHLELLGYGGNDGFDVHDVDAYHALIHPDDLPLVLDAEIRNYRYLNPIRGPEKKDYKLVYDYRVRAKSGSYLRFLHQFALFELDRNWNSWILLIVSDLLSALPDDAPPRRFLIDTRTGRVLLFGGESGVSGQLLTTREREILALVAQGCDSAEIADRLCVSRWTVENHRRNALRKTGSRNAAQAAAYASLIGLI
jgi:DNA-binding CsgD family transcriptional regulator